MDDEARHFKAEGRDGIRDEHYRAFLLLPFDDGQMLEYFRNTFPDEPEPQRYIDLLGSVHNLLELGQRPYLLNQIREQLPTIERWKAEGRLVNGALLYGHTVSAWLQRDFGKHNIPEPYKAGLMEYLAAALHRSGQKVWNVAQLERWLVDYLDAHPHVRRESRDDAWELLKEDLRTATFLVREGQDGFRFAHTSLQEFFVASYLHKALLAGRLEEWQMPLPSRETLDFLGQLLALGGEGGLSAGGGDAVAAGVRALRQGYRAQASELLLVFGLHAARQGHAALALAGIQLQGARLADLELCGPVPGEGEPPFNLRGAVLRGAELGNAVWRNVQLDGADFGGAMLARAEFHGCRMADSCFEGAELEGTLWRGCNLERAGFSGAHCESTRLLLCRTQGVTGLEGGPPQVWLGRDGENVGASEGSMAGGRWVLMAGHVDRVRSVAFAPDGLHLLSTGNDRTIRLWDVAAGTCRRLLVGHEGTVTCAAFSANGTHIVSASDDCTLRLWDTSSGVCVSSCEGHDGVVNSVAFLPDGMHFVSASRDSTLRLWQAKGSASRLQGGVVCRSVLTDHKAEVTSVAVAPDGLSFASADSDGNVMLWDAANGRCRAEFKGHAQSIRSLAFSPDGLRIVSASEDGCLRLWDVATAECLMLFQGHAGPVWCVAFESGGRHIASSGADHVVRLWDAATGECQAVLVGHKRGGSGVAFSPDGNRVVSASWDGTLRLWDSASAECAYFGERDRSFRLNVTGCAVWVLRG